MIVDPYKTEILRSYNAELLRRENLKNNTMYPENAVAIHGDANPYTNRGNASMGEYSITLVIPGSTTPAWKHPLILEHPARTPKWDIVVDGRSFTRRPKQTMDVRGDVYSNVDYVVASRTDFEFQLGRAFLTGVAMTGPRQGLMALGDLPVRSFAYWLSERIGSRLDLAPEEQQIVLGVAAYYYTSMFYTEDEFTQDEQARAVIRLNRIFSDVARIPADLGWIANLKDFCEAVKKATNESVRLEGLHSRYVQEVTGSTWRGMESREAVIVALESPITWIAIVERCVKEMAFYKKAPLGSVVERQARRGVGDAFLKQLALLSY